jgi:hypothetical protein
MQPKDFYKWMKANNRNKSNDLEDNESLGIPYLAPPPIDNQQFLFCGILLFTSPDRG